MNHEERVEHWLGASFATLPVEQQLAALERGFSALWTRARGTLGDVTLGAIGERVLVHARDRFSFLAGATLDRDGLHCATLTAPSSDVLDEAVRHLLVELLKILGRLTAEILTPALHDELENTLRPSSAHVRPRSAAASASKTSTPSKTSATSKTSKASVASKVTKATKASRAKSSKPSKTKKRASQRGESA